MYACAFPQQCSEQNIELLAFQVGQVPLSPCSRLLKWIFAQYWLALNPQQCLHLHMAAGDHHQGKKINDKSHQKRGRGWISWGDARKEMECRLRGWWQRYQKKIFYLNRASLNNPPIILCFSAHHWASDFHAMQSGPHQCRQPDREKKQWGWQKCKGLWWMVGQAPHCRIPER